MFGLYDESGTIIASWPDPSRKPAVPVPYAQETMHGMEYAFGQMLKLSGALDDGARVVAAVRDRYDGERRNPWNEIECGSNYARSMAAWGAVVVLSGFTFDAGRGHIGFHPRVRGEGAFQSIWSGPGAYGTVRIEEGAVTVVVLGGTLRLASLGLPLRGGRPTEVVIDSRPTAMRIEGDELLIEPVDLGPGSTVRVLASTISVGDLPMVDGLGQRVPSAEIGMPDSLMPVGA